MEKATHCYPEDWYNWKYGRVGHLFQDRFKSEPIETDEYFLTVLRYIHQNPLKANMCKKLEDYAYSSYKDYVGENVDKSSTLVPDTIKIL